MLVVCFPFFIFHPFNGNDDHSTWRSGQTHLKRSWNKYNKFTIGHNTLVGDIVKQMILTKKNGMSK